MIRSYVVTGLAALILMNSCSPTANQASVSLFNGYNFQGWEGDTLLTWKIRDSAIVGGSLNDTVPHNDFICTVNSYNNFHLRAKFKLMGDTGFVNSGIQFRSKRLQNPAYEMSGYQADLGKGYWGSLYDESRRNKTLAILDSAQAARLVKKDQWNDFEIICQGTHIQIFLNGEKTADYNEQDASIPQTGLIALQVHGGGKTEAWFKNIFLEKLP